jgi:hypothetical protein
MKEEEANSSPNFARTTWASWRPASSWRPARKNSCWRLGRRLRFDSGAITGEAEDNPSVEPLSCSITREANVDLSHDDRA